MQLSMSLDLGYLVSTAVFAVVFVAAVAVQIAAKGFRPFLYWATIIASTTVGTTLADFADRSLGIGYAGGTTLLRALLLVSLFTWYRTLGSIVGGQRGFPGVRDVLLGHDHVLADAGHGARRQDRGYRRARLPRRRCAVQRTAGAGGRSLTTGPDISRTMLFWAAFVLTWPLGAVPRRLPRQAAQFGRPGAQSLHRLAGAAGFHRSLHRHLSATPGRKGALTPPAGGRASA